MNKPRLARTLLGAAAALPLSLASPAMAADHRDAPTIDDYSAIDINDVFLFRDPPCTTAICTSPNLVVALSTQAVADPQFGSSYHFQENALYRLNFTTRKDAEPTAHIDFVFGPFGNGPACPAPAPACQTYRAVFPNHVVIEGLATQGTSAATHLAPVVTTAGDIKVFAGPREDPFFFDLVGFNRSIAAGANKFTGVDAFKGKNINAIVVEFPVNMVFPSGSCTLRPTPPFFTPCGVWAVTYLGNFGFDDPEKFEARPEALRQVDRMGNPAVNTALIPAALKDSFNFGQPEDDPKNFAGVILKQILTLDQKFGTCPPTATSAASCNPNVPLLASVAVPDVLRFASNVPDGFPNGRQPADRTTDILISLILQIPGFTDGTAVKTYCSVFPFLGPPLQLSGTAPFQIIQQSCP
jgi:Domain of unknown function (DUF4331)